MTVILCSHKWCQLSVCHHHFVGSPSVQQLYCQDPPLVMPPLLILPHPVALLRVSLSSGDKQPALTIAWLQASPKTECHELRGYIPRIKVKKYVPIKVRVCLKMLISPV